MSKKIHTKASEIRQKLQPYKHQANAEEIGSSEVAAENIRILKVDYQTPQFSTIRGHVTNYKPKSSWDAYKKLQVNYRPIGYANGKISVGQSFKYNDKIRPQWNPKGGGVPEFFIPRTTKVSNSGFKFFSDYLLQLNLGNLAGSFAGGKWGK